MADPNVSTRDRDTVLPDRLLDIDEVADFLNCCRATVRREVARRKLRARKVGAHLRFQPEDVAAYLDGQTQAGTAERDAWDAYVRKVVAEAPPLRPEQIAALSALLDWEPDKRLLPGGAPGISSRQERSYGSQKE